MWHVIHWYGTGTDASVALGTESSIGRVADSDAAQAGDSGTARANLFLQSLLYR